MTENLFHQFLLLSPDASPENIARSRSLLPTTWASLTMNRWANASLRAGRWYYDRPDDSDRAMRALMMKRVIVWSEFYQPLKSKKYEQL